MNRYRALLCTIVLACLPHAVMAAPPAVPERLAGVARMLSAARLNDAQALWDAKNEIEELPYPSRGERRRARSLNAAALDLFKAGQLPAAIEQFERAFALDPSDPEITNNYGYVLFRARRLEDADRLLRYTAALSPGRSTAWANLAEALASRGTPGDAQTAAAALVAALQFSRNPEATRTYLEKLAAASDVAGLKEAVALALSSPLPARGGSPSNPGHAALAGTAAERLALARSEPAASVPSSPSVPAAPASYGTVNAGAASAAPVSLAQPFQRLMASLPSPEVQPLHVAASKGSAEARASLLKLAHDGNARAQYAVGDLYDAGRGIAANAEVANSWYRRSAAQGFVLAQANLARNQQYGFGTPIDLAFAQDNYRRAAEQGHPTAMNNLGVMLVRGQGMKADPEEGVAWFLRSADAGLARGAFNAGLLIERGQGIAADQKRAFAYYLSAAMVDFPQAQLKVAQACEYGWGGSKDRAQAIAWYRKAALAGLEPARDALKRLGVADE